MKEFIKNNMLPSKILVRIIPILLPILFVLNISAVEKALSPKLTIVSEKNNLLANVIKTNYVEINPFRESLYGLEKTFSSLFNPKSYSQISFKASVIKAVEKKPKQNQNGLVAGAEVYISADTPKSPEVVTKVVTNRIIERVIEKPIYIGMSKVEIDSSLEKINQQIISLYRQVSLTQRIDKLANTVISSPTIVGGSITNIITNTTSSIDGTSPSLGTTTATNIIITNTSTSTFAGGISVTGGCVTVNGTCIGTGSGSSSVFPFDSFVGYNATGTIIGLLNGFFSTASSTQLGNFYLPALSQGFRYSGTNGLTQTISTSTLASQVFSAMTFAPNSIITTNSDGNLIATGTQLTVGNLISTTTNTSSFLGTLGIGTTSPAARLAVNSVAGEAFSFWVGSTTAPWMTISNTGFGTTTLSGLNILGFATSTSNMGFNITTGCYAVNGACVGGGSSQWTTTGSDIYYILGNVGFGTTSPQEKVHISNGSFLVDSPINPTLESTLTTSGNARGISVQGNYAYIAAGTTGLQIVDISNPATTTLLSVYNSPGGGYDVYVSGRYAYLADQSSGVQIVDISNPTSPIAVGTYDTTGNAYGVYVSGKYLYVADDISGLEIFDISNPTNPTLIGTYNTTGNSYGVYVSGKYAYVADDLSGLMIIDVSNPTLPYLVGSYNTPGEAYGVYVSGKYAYVADYGSGLEIFDISNPANPLLKGTYNTSGLSQEIYLAGKYAYVSDTASGLQIIDVSSSTAPYLVGTYDTTGNALETYVSGKYAYVADDGVGLQVIDIKGAEISSLHAGNIFSNDVNVSENIIAGNNIYGGGLNIGMGGLFSQGGGHFFSLATTSLSLLPALSATLMDSNNSSVVDVLNLTHLASSTTASNGIGTGILFSMEDTTGVATATARIASIFTSAGGAATSSVLAFYTKSSLSDLVEGMRLTHNGMLGIGTTSPAARLAVNSVAGDAFSFWVGSTTAPWMTISNTGFGTTTVRGLTINGSATSTSNVGFNITTGCYAVSGVCVGGGSFTNTIASGGTGSTSFSPNSIVVSNAAGTALIATGTQLTVGNILATTTATSTFAGAIGVGTTTPWGNGFFTVGTSTPALYVDRTTGFVGVGTAIPTTKLNVYGDSGLQVLNVQSNTTQLYMYANDNSGGFASIGTASNNPLLLQTNGAEVARFTTAGRFGLGTSTPWAMFSINPNALGSNVPEFVVGSSSSTHLIVDSAGRVGIGTATTSGVRLVVTNNTSQLPSPALATIATFSGADGTPSRVTIESFNTNSNLTIRRSNTSAASPSALAIDNNIGQVSFMGYGATGYLGATGIIKGVATQAFSDTAGGTALSFSTTPNNSVTAVETMRLDQNGFLGLATTTPSYLLTIASSTAPQLGLSAGAGLAQWIFRNAGGNLYLSTTTVSGLSTTTTAAMTIVASNGYVGFGTTTVTLGPLQMSSGAFVTTGGVWTNASDVNLKENFTELDPEIILHKIADLPVTQWNYKSEVSSIKHIGPTAQDFHSTFDLGNNNTSISTIDPAGVALVAIKAIDMRLSLVASSSVLISDSGSYVGKFFANVFARVAVWLADAANGITNIFANNLNAKEKICVDGECLTKDDVKVLLALVHNSVDTSNPNVENTTTHTVSDTTSPTITMQGDNPAVITYGTSYNDLGASVTDTDENGNINNNLGLHFNVDGIDVESISIDTTMPTTTPVATTTHTIIYSAVDGAGNWGYATRTVDVIPQ